MSRYSAAVFNINRDRKKYVLELSRRKYLATFIWKKALFYKFMRPIFLNYENNRISKATCIKNT